MTLGEKIDKYLGHWPNIIADEASTFFDEEDLREKIDDVVLRMIEIVFEQGELESWTDLIEEACRNCEVRTIDDNQASG